MKDTIGKEKNDEELELWKKYYKNRDEETRNIFIERYALLVKYVVGRMFSSPMKNIDFNELLSAGTFGLFDAVEKFDPTMNVQFKTYAITRIQGAIRDELRSLDPVPRSQRTHIREIDRVATMLHERNECEPTIEEILNTTGLTRKQYDKAMSCISQAYTVSLHDVLFTNSDGEQIIYFDQVGTSSEDAPEQAFAQKDLVRVLQKALSELPERELQVLILYHYEELTLKEIGKVLGVTESRVSQLHGRALSKLRTKLFSYRKGVFEK